LVNLAHKETLEKMVVPDFQDSLVIQAILVGKDLKV